MNERKEKFTPGPWMAHCESDFSSVLAGDDHNTEVCYCECQFVDDEQRTVAHNAMLIAASPEMYEMLDNIQSLMEDTPFRGIAAKIGAILAKARGEAQK